jgi:NTP pyrophosphatase (non-canonical NTP hydrolase)
MRSIEEYIKEMQDDSARWFPNGGRDLVVLVLGLVGEAGEVADQLKKYLRDPVDWDGRLDKMMVEIIDVFHYWCLLVGLLDIDVDEVYRKKREHNIQRYEHDRV